MVTVFKLVLYILFKLVYIVQNAFQEIKILIIYYISLQHKIAGYPENTDYC